MQEDYHFTIAELNVPGEIPDALTPTRKLPEGRLEGRDGTEKIPAVGMIKSVRRGLKECREFLSSDKERVFNEDLEIVIADYVGGVFEFQQ